MKRFAAGILLCLAALGVILVVRDFDRSRYDPSAPYQDKIAYWKKRIHTVGGNRAYEELALAQSGFVHGMQHNETHIFASALYSEEGIRGIEVCDGRFEYACFHQLVGEALSDLGTGSLKTIMESCKEGPGCKHSIGHGALALEGYSFNDLEKAVSLCASLPSDVYVQGCYGGAIMEYNMRTLLGDARSVRTMEADWFEPCGQLPKSAQRVCYFWQPTWWRSFLQSADQTLSPSALGAMGEHCRAIRDRALSDACFEGVGVSALNASRTTEEGLAACTSVSNDMRDQARCRTSAARLVALLQGTELGRLACFGLAGAYSDSCIRVVERANPETSYLGEVLPFEKTI